MPNGDNSPSFSEIKRRRNIRIRVDKTFESESLEQQCFHVENEQRQNILIKSIPATNESLS